MGRINQLIKNEMEATSGTPRPSIEVQQLIDFLPIHLGTMSAIADRLGYSDTSISNMYHGRTPHRHGFTLMLRQLAFETTALAAHDGTLVAPASPDPVKRDKEEIEAIVRRVMDEVSKAA